jgi:hypothetical protein
MLANMMQVMNQCMQQHLAPITMRLVALEDAKATTTWDYNPHEETYMQYGIGNIDIDRGYADYTMPKQQTLLAQQNEVALHYMQLDEEEQCRLNNDEDNRTKWANANAEECTHLAEVAGANSENLGEEANPIYIPDSQESTYPPAPPKDTIFNGRGPIDRLTWQQVPIKGNRQTTPSSWSTSTGNT